MLAFLRTAWFDRVSGGLGAAITFKIGSDNGKQDGFAAFADRRSTLL
jgi:hypothetical protein